VLARRIVCFRHSKPRDAYPGTGPQILFADLHPARVTSPERPRALGAPTAVAKSPPWSQHPFI
jgi:hypothetical protein